MMVLLGGGCLVEVTGWFSGDMERVAKRERREKDSGSPGYLVVMKEGGRKGGQVTS